MYAAVYFDTKLQTSGFADFHEQLHLFQARTDEGLATEAGIHAHYEDVMDYRKDFVECVDRSCRVYDDARLAAV